MTMLSASQLAMTIEIFQLNITESESNFFLNPLRDTDISMKWVHSKIATGQKLYLLGSDVPMLLDRIQHPIDFYNKFGILPTTMSVWLLTISTTSVHENKVYIRRDIPELEHGTLWKEIQSKLYYYHRNSNRSTNWMHTDCENELQVDLLCSHETIEIKISDLILYNVKDIRIAIELFPNSIRSKILGNNEFYEELESGKDPCMAYIEINKDIFKFKYAPFINTSDCKDHVTQYIGGSGEPEDAITYANLGALFVHEHYGQFFIMIESEDIYSKVRKGISVQDSYGTVLGPEGYGIINSH